MAARGMKDRDSKLDQKSSHLLLLAENDTGYRNLLKIASAAQLDGFYYYPRIDHDFLAAHSEGLDLHLGLHVGGDSARAAGGKSARKPCAAWTGITMSSAPTASSSNCSSTTSPRLLDLNSKLVELGARYSAQICRHQRRALHRAGGCQIPGHPAGHPDRRAAQRPEPHADDRQRPTTCARRRR